MSNTTSELLLTKDYEFLAKINKHPEIKACVEEILGIAQSEYDGCRTANEAEDTVTKNLRQLGGKIMHSWANTMEARVARKVKEEHPEYKLREKKIS